MIDQSFMTVKRSVWETVESENLTGIFNNKRLIFASKVILSLIFMWLWKTITRVLDVTFDTEIR